MNESVASEGLCDKFWPTFSPDRYAMPCLELLVSDNLDSGDDVSDGDCDDGNDESENIVRGGITKKLGHRIGPPKMILTCASLFPVIEK